MLYITGKFYNRAYNKQYKIDDCRCIYYYKDYYYFENAVFDYDGFGYKFKHLYFGNSGLVLDIVRGRLYLPSTAFSVDYKCSNTIITSDSSNKTERDKTFAHIKTIFKDIIQLTTGKNLRAESSHLIVHMFNTYAIKVYLHPKRAIIIMFTYACVIKRPVKSSIMAQLILTEIRGREVFKHLPAAADNVEQYLLGLKKY